MSGSLALVGGGEWTEGCTFDDELLASSGAEEVVVIPTAAAYEHPDRVVDAATAWFAARDVAVTAVMVVGRPDALVREHVQAVADAPFIYLSGGSPMHLRSVLKDTPLWDALVGAWRGGAVLAAAAAAARAICDPMVDPRGGAFTVGLGLLEELAVIPHHDHWSKDKAKRTLDLAPSGLRVVGIDERTALIREGDEWRASGAGEVAVFVDGQPAELADLP